MNTEDILLLPPKIECEPWQLGTMVSHEIQKGGIALVFCSEERGAGKNATGKDFHSVRKELYHLSKLDFEVPISDLGDLISGKTHEDSHYILEELALSCLSKGAIPVVIGGSNDLGYSLLKAINLNQNSVNYTQINSFVHLNDEGDKLTEKNFLARIFSDKEIHLKDYFHLGYQKHLNEIDSVKLMKNVNFETLRLSEMMGTMDKAEPFLRRADLVTINCDAVESFIGGFSINPQVNGLNRREICACMKEIGLGENLKSVGIFNYNAESKNLLNVQLLAQMLWYLIEGINIQKTHPKERQYETFIVMMEEMNCVFKRDVFRGVWYFGDNDDIQKCIPCSVEDYENAKKGILARRLK